MELSEYVLETLREDEQFILTGVTRDKQRGKQKHRLFSFWHLSQYAPRWRASRK